LPIDFQFASLDFLFWFFTLKWNAPLLLFALKLAPALVTGNAVVLKSAEAAPFGTFRRSFVLFFAPGSFLIFGANHRRAESDRNPEPVATSGSGQHHLR